MPKNTVIGALALLLASPVAAQQPPAAAAPSTPPAPRGPMGPGPGMMGGQGPGGMMGGQGMMGGPGRPGMGQGAPMRGMLDDDDDDDGDDRRRGRASRHHQGGHHGGRDMPMQIIINIGPNNRVEVEQDDDRDGRRGERGQMGRQGAMGEARRGGPAVADAHLGALRQALQLRPDQQQAWDRFAGAARDAAGRMGRARMEAMSQAQNLDERIASYESALASRLEAVRGVRSAFSELSGALDETQRRTLDDSATAFMGGGRMGAHRR